MGQGDTAVARTEVPRYKECAFGNPGSGPHTDRAVGLGVDQRVEMASV